MKKVDFLHEISKTLQAETDLTEETVLGSDVEWDSLAMISVLALFNKNLKQKLPASDIREVKTVGDILNLGKYEE